MPTSSGTTVGTSQAPLPTLPRSPRIASLDMENLASHRVSAMLVLRPLTMNKGLWKPIVFNKIMCIILPVFCAWF
ncbi:MAG: hypothetical protein Q8R24_08985 [Legionellaceae bacterium]|nr:hypothetical protein [Legionellaceae bacterium]